MQGAPAAQEAVWEGIRRNNPKEQSRLAQSPESVSRSQASLLGV